MDCAIFAGSSHVSRLAGGMGVSAGKLSQVDKGFRAQLRDVPESPFFLVYGIEKHPKPVVYE